MKNMVKTGMLPKNVNPPLDILLLPPLDYLKWIDSLPEHLKYKIMQASSSCSIQVLGFKKVCFRGWRGGGRVHPKGPRHTGKCISQEPHGPHKHLLRQETVAVTCPPPF